MVLTTLTAAGFCTADSRVVALTISFLAVRLLTITTFFGETTVLETSLFDTRLRIRDLFFKLGRILAGSTRTVFPTDLPS
jgi:hypothetical protein